MNIPGFGSGLRRHLLLAVLVFGSAFATLPAAAQISNDPEFLRGQVAAHDGDFETALREWLPLAENGHARAQYAVGALVAEGLGTPRDIEGAFAWWLRSADNGFGPARLNVASMYKEGLGVERNDVEALKWLRRGAADDDWRAQLELSRYYAKGCGVEADPVTAYMWLAIARSSGQTTAPGDLLTALAGLTETQRRDGASRAEAWIGENR